MKDILTRLALAAAITLAAFAITSDAQQSGNQQPDEDRTPVSPHQQPAPAPKSSTQTQTPTAPEKSASAGTNDEQTQDALAFTGRLQENNGALVLYDAVTKVSYQLDDPSKARPYVGKQVKIVGKLGMRSNTIHIDSVEIVP